MTMSRTKNFIEDLATIHALVLYMHNMPNSDIFSVAYGETEDFRHAERYREEKLDDIRRGGLELLWGHLDSEGRERLVSAALDKYFDEALRAMSHNHEEEEDE